MVLALRSQEALVEVEQDCRARGGQVLVVPTDIADPAAVDRLARLAVPRCSPTGWHRVSPSR
ncbi:hypothetical protein [Micromonospora sp. NPDC004551]|uniref:hypothetical protein n=1 Tax=Micromonospora sp. NPDC004551 TaxID=3154284 RepID=UPI0033A54F66